MGLQIGLLSPVIPVTREAFGPDGKGTIVAQVDFACCGEDPVGLLLTDSRDLWTHPGLLSAENRLKGLTWYRLTLEGDEVVMRHEPERFSARTDPRVFRAPPLVLASTPVDNLARLVRRIAEQDGRCHFGGACAGARDRPLDWRRSVLAEPARYSGWGLVAMCGRCHDALTAQDVAIRDEHTAFDGRRALPHAALQVTALPG